jgi:hypothetical protein
MSLSIADKSFEPTVSPNSHPHKGSKKILLGITQLEGASTHADIQGYALDGAEVNDDALASMADPTGQLLKETPIEAIIETANALAAYLRGRMHGAGAASQIIAGLSAADLPTPDEMVTLADTAPSVVFGPLLVYVKAFYAALTGNYTWLSLIVENDIDWSSSTGEVYSDLLVRWGVIDGLRWRRKDIPVQMRVFVNSDSDTPQITLVAALMLVRRLWVFPLAVVQSEACMIGLAKAFAADTRVSALPDWAKATFDPELKKFVQAVGPIGYTNFTRTGETDTPVFDFSLLPQNVELINHYWSSLYKVPKESLEVARKFFGYVEDGDRLIINLAMFSELGSASAEDNSDSSIMVGSSLTSAISLLNAFRTLTDVVLEMGSAAHRSFGFVTNMIKDMFTDIKLSDLQGYADLNSVKVYFLNHSRVDNATDVAEYELCLPKAVGVYSNIFLMMIATTPDPAYHLLTYEPGIALLQEQLVYDEYFARTEDISVDLLSKEYFDLRDENDNLMGWYFETDIANILPYEDINYPWYVDRGPSDANLVDRLRMELVNGSTTHVVAISPDIATSIVGNMHNIHVKEPSAARHIIPDWEALALILARGEVRSSGGSSTEGDGSDDNESET